jgi:hypothetical protein
MLIDRRCVSIFLSAGCVILWPTVVRADVTGDVALWLGLPTALAGLIAAAVSFLAPKIWETYNTTLVARRKFIEGVTADVVKLASTHYWALANAAGTVGDLLDEHLQSVQAHLLLAYARPGQTGTEPARRLGERIDELCRDTADRSFPSLVQLIVLFDRFQFAGSQTYLLPRHAAGIALRKLFNQFAAALPADGFTAAIRQGVETHLVREAKPTSGAPVFGMAGSFLDNPERLDELDLTRARDRYCRWLRENPVSVSEAADALRAYAELFSHELADLNRVFFRDRGRNMTTNEFGMQMALSSTWSGTLTENSLLSFARAGLQSEFYRPLGGIHALPQPKSAAAKPPEDRVSEKPASSTMGQKEKTAADAGITAATS